MTAPKPTNPPSEKATEMLFTTYLFREIGLQKIILFAPSTVEEEDLGYDALYTSYDSCWELIIQFKKPNLRKKDGFTMPIYGDQHRLLHSLVSKGHDSFYVCATYRDLFELESLQRNISEPCRFLDNHIVVRTSDLKADSSSIRYERDYVSSTVGWKPTKTRHCIRGSGCRSNSNYHLIPTYSICSLITAFINRGIGYRVIMENASPNAIEYARQADSNVQSDSNFPQQPIQGEAVSEIKSALRQMKYYLVLRAHFLTREG